MNTSNRILHAGLAALLAGSVSTANAETTPGTASALVVTPLTMLETIPLDFGSLAGGALAGTVSIDEAGVRTSAGGAAVVTASVPSKATFSITGAISTNITVTTDATGAQLDLAGGGTPMPLSSIVTTALPTTTDASGDASFDLGATLTVNASQPAGTYTTALGAGQAYSVTVNYD